MLIQSVVLTRERLQFGSVMAVRSSDGLVFSGNDGERFKITQLSINRKMVPAHTFGKAATASSIEVEFTDGQKELIAKVKGIWSSILVKDASTITNETDFFECGAGSLDVTRYVFDASLLTLQVAFQYQGRLRYRA